MKSYRGLRTNAPIRRVPRFINILHRFYMRAPWLIIGCVTLVPILNYSVVPGSGELFLFVHTRRFTKFHAKTVTPRYHHYTRMFVDNGGRKNKNKTLIGIICPVFLINYIVFSYHNFVPRLSVVTTSRRFRVV